MENLFSIAITLVFAGLIFIAMAFDMWSRRVPNMISVALVVLFAVAAGVAWDQVDWWSHIGFGLGMFLLGAILFYIGWFGGGDVKLLGALSLWMGLPLAAEYLMLVGLAGGLAALVILVLRRVIKPFVAAWEKRGLRVPEILSPGGTLPYGVVLGVAALITARKIELLAWF